MHEGDLGIKERGVDTYQERVQLYNLLIFVTVSSQFNPDKKDLLNQINNKYQDGRHRRFD